MTDETPKTYKAKLHVASSRFSYIEVEVEGDASEIVRVHEALEKRYKDVPKN